MEREQNAVRNFLVSVAMGFGFVLPASLWAHPHPGKHDGQFVENCPRRDLIQKDCHIALGDFSVHVWSEKILLNTKVDRLTRPLTDHEGLKLETLVWEFVRSKKLGGRWLLELGVWAPPNGESDVETLLWVVHEVGAN